MKQPKTSIIMPTYNRAYILPTAIQSVIDQTDTDWELLIIDDGSMDDTASVVKAMGDSRIVYLSQENKGAAAARNHGLRAAKSEWIAYLDSDNELLPEYLRTMHEWFAKNLQAIFGIPRAHRTLELYEGGKLVKLIDDSKDTPLGLTIKDVFMRNLHFDTNGFMHRRSLFSEDGITWDEAMVAMEDWDIAMVMGEKYPDGFLYVEEVLYNYHQRYGGDGVVSNTGYGKWAEVFEQIYQKHKDDKLMEGQTWYPDRVEKWKRLQREFEEGKLPPYERYYFERD